MKITFELPKELEEFIKLQMEYENSQSKEPKISIEEIIIMLLIELQGIKNKNNTSRMMQISSYYSYSFKEKLVKCMENPKFHECINNLFYEYSKCENL